MLAGWNDFCFGKPFALFISSSTISLFDFGAGGGAGGGAVGVGSKGWGPTLFLAAMWPLLPK